MLLKIQHRDTAFWTERCQKIDIAMLIASSLSTPAESTLIIGESLYFGTKNATFGKAYFSFYFS